MAVYKDTEAMYDILGGLFNTLMDDPSFGPKFTDANLSIKFIITNPDGVLYLKPTGVFCGEQPPDFKPDVTMSLAGDTCHKFWLKKVNMPIALAKRQIKAKGPINKVLKLLPILKPASLASPLLTS